MSLVRHTVAKVGAAALLSILPMCCLGAGAPTAVEQGADLYRQYCESCHGRDMITAGGVAFDLRKFPANEGERFGRSVLNGKGGMPSWRDTLSNEDVANLWAYVKSGGAKR